jgi:hypothetical protein
MLMKLEYSRQIFEKYPIIKFLEHASDGSRVVPCEQRRTDGHDEANSHFSKLCRFTFSRHHELQVEVQ